jgi:lipopolysaccharide/colanic/teichoic acid biosynthesis glycosyltransferase
MVGLQQDVFIPGGRVHEQELMAKSGKHIVFVTTSSVAYVLSRGQFRFWREAGYQPTFISSPGPEHEWARAEGADVVAVPMVRDGVSWQDLAAFAKLWRMFLSSRLTISVVSTPKAGLLGGIAAVFAGVPARVYILRGLRYETVRGIKRALLKSAERLACACADRVICVSPSLKRQALADALGPDGKFVVLGSGSSNGVDLERFRPAQPDEARAARQRLGLTETEFVIGFVGRFVHDKGVLDLIAAFAEVRAQLPAKLVMVGDGFDADGGSSDLARAAIKNLADVIVVPSTPDLVPFYRAMNVLVLPTYREGFPNVVLEAQACARPVITTNATGAIDSIMDGETGMIVPVADVKALAAALVKIGTDAASAQRMGAAGRRRVEALFDRKIVWQQLADFYAAISRSASRQRGMSALVKAIADRVFAFVLLVVLAPVLLVLSVMILAILGWPVIFKQARLGKDGKLIHVHKFRSMSERRDSAGNLLPDSERLSKLGRWLRASSLDELPQLWDVLVGNVSFVGPRPLFAHYRERYSPEQSRRHNVKPGITGLAQVSGRNTLTWEEKFALDVSYVDEWSLGLDLRILMRTFLKVLRREGISQAGYEGAPEFMGSDVAHSKPAASVTSAKAN